MRQGTKYSKIVVLTLVALWSYGLMTAFVPGNILSEILNGLFLGVVGALAIVLSPIFLRSLTSGGFDRVSQLTIGIALTWTALIILAALSVYINAAGAHVRNAIQPLVGFARFLSIIGGVMMISAPGMVDGRWQHNKRLLAVGVALGLLIAVAVLYVQRVGLPG